MTPRRAAQPVDIRVGRRIRSLRASHGLTQKQLGLAIGVSFQQVQKYEKGINRVSSSRLSAIAERLGTPVSVLFDESPTGEAAPGPEVMDDVQDLLNAFRGIGDAEWRYCLITLARMIEKTGRIV